MKYGPIICDPKSEEAKALVGKKVVGGYDFTELKDYPERHTIATLNYIKNTCNPFVCCATPYTFIRGVVEDAPKYRPYKDTGEMVEDYCERFDVRLMDFDMPSIWLKAIHYGATELITKFGTGAVVFDQDCYNTLDWIFGNYTYLDGSPVGKEVNG